MSGEPIKESGINFETITTAHEDYVRKGGILDSKSFYRLDNFQGLDKSQVSKGSLEASRSQANSYASEARIRLTDQEVDMYILLRTLTEDNRPVKTGKKPQKLNDHELLAEILRVTDPAKHEKFVAKYPVDYSRFDK